MTFRLATRNDCPLLAELNHQLAEDEGHRNQFKTVPQLEDRMRGFLSTQYRAVIFDDGGKVVAHALYREDPDEIYLRRAIEILRSQIWPTGKRLTVDVLVGNLGAIAFWRSVGYQDYYLALEILPDKPASP